MKLIGTSIFASSLHLSRLPSSPDHDGLFLDKHAHSTGTLDTKYISLLHSDTFYKTIESENGKIKAITESPTAPATTISNVVSNDSKT
jgi:hypothetical protein